ncbi:CLUMA_CG001165, isoform A [Clunio marinus]|uniref:CLUMA_CG001165, isoform A n=1 Tax=Clunio marinus TaxID=568069 RepID=A0A1J1HHK1_9DIPT|nr:CLUMA_CG001165, isoform A [Clunio marinus]
MNSLIYSNSHSAKSDDANGNLMGTIVPTTTNDEDSLSLSDYTDNEKSAPTELLAEFLTSIMKKDYGSALKYCKKILDYEPNNKTAKDFYPQLLAKVNEQNSTSSDGSDANCNYSSSLEFVGTEVLDNDDDDNVSVSSSISSSISSNDDDSDLVSISEEMNQCDRDDLINSLSHSSSRSSNLSKSEQLPESMSSTESNKENTSNSFSFTSLLLDDSEDINNNEPPAEPVKITNQTPSSPFTSKIMQMFKGKWDAANPSKEN